MSTLKVGTIQDNQNSITAMTIDGTGRVLTPARPFFHVAGLSSDMSVGTGSDQVIPFSNVLHNVGSHYSTGNNRFTAPINGIYQFCASVRLDQLDQDSSYIRLGLRTETGSGSAVTPTDFYDLLDAAGYDTESTYRTFQLSRALHMTAGNTIRATMRQQGGTANHSHIDASQTYTQFSGYLVG